jgi:hypothetical protein
MTAQQHSPLTVLSFRTGLAFAAMAVSSSSALAGFGLEGTIWGGGFPGPSEESFSSVGSSGGSGGGSTGGGVGGASISVEAFAIASQRTIRLTGSAFHPDGDNGYSVAFSSNARSNFIEGFLLTIDQEMEFSIANASSASAFASGFGDLTTAITPAQLVGVTGIVTSADGSTGRLSAGTYRLNVFIGGVAAGFYEDIVPEFAGYEAVLAFGTGVRSATLDWTLTMTAIPAPGLALFAIGPALHVPRRRRS